MDTSEWSPSKLSSANRTRLTAAEALGLIVRVRDPHEEFEIAVREFIARWGFDPSGEDLCEENREWLVEQSLAGEPAVRFALCVGMARSVSEKDFRANLTDDIAKFKIFQHRRFELEREAGETLLDWIIGGKLESWGQPAFFDSRICDPAKPVETISQKDAARRNTTFVLMQPADRAEGEREFWLVCNYSDIFNVPAEVYQAERKSWGNVTFFEAEVLELLGLSRAAVAGTYRLDDNSAAAFAPSVIKNSKSSATAAAPSRASDEQVRSAIRTLHRETLRLQMKPPNKVEMRKPIASLLLASGLRRNQTEVGDIADEVEFSELRIPTGDKRQGGFLPFSLEDWQKSRREI